MDNGSGHIYNLEDINIKDVKGKLIPWKVGEKVVVKNCRFIVKEIRVSPVNEVVLVGIPQSLTEMLSMEEKFLEEESNHKILDFVRKKRG